MKKEEINNLPACYFKMGVPSSRPIADFLPTISIKAKDLYGQCPIEKEHVDNNSAVRDMLLQRDIRPEQLLPGEDVKMVKKRIKGDDQQVLINKNTDK